MRRYNKWMLLIGLSAVVFGCGQSSPQSSLDWEPSRTDSEQYAYLWPQDLEDKFLFGTSIINVEGPIPGALDFKVDPFVTTLSVNEEKGTLEVLADKDVVLSFDVEKKGTRFEVDFASAGNDLQFNNFISVVAGRTAVGSRDGVWLSTKKPTVTFIDQDNDTVVVNVEHTVQQGILGTDDQGNRLLRRLFSRAESKVTVRVWLKRLKSLPQIGGTKIKTVQQGLDKDIGFFASSMKFPFADQLPIQRFAIGDVQDAQPSITFYLKDFPERFAKVAKEAVLSWNKAFDGNQTIKVAIAPDHIDVGDPRYYVIKWFSRLDAGLRRLGVAKAIVNPLDGLVIGGGIYIAGTDFVEKFEARAAYTEEVQGHQIKPTVTFGGVNFARVEGENPIIPFLMGSGQSSEKYIDDYYSFVFTHELGHVFGLRHNFRASTVPTANGDSVSVMDYMSRPQSVTGPAAYDIAAIRWGYYNETPAQKIPFCRDEDISENWDCNLHDSGNPVNYVLRSLIDGADFISQVPVPIESPFIVSGMIRPLHLAKKIHRLQKQLPEAVQETVSLKLRKAYQRILSMTPHEDLEGKELEIVKNNVENVKSFLIENQ